MNHLDSLFESFQSMVICSDPCFLAFVMVKGHDKESLPPHRRHEEGVEDEGQGRY